MIEFLVIVSMYGYAWYSFLCDEAEDKMEGF